MSEITWDDVRVGDWISTGWGSQHRVRSMTDTHVTVANHSPGDAAEKARVNLNASEERRCPACERAGGPDGLGPARPGVVGEVRRTPEGWVAVCVTARRWRFVGDFPPGSHGWAENWFMGNAETVVRIPGTPAAEAVSR